MTLGGVWQLSFLGFSMKYSVLPVLACMALLSGCSLFSGSSESEKYADEQPVVRTARPAVDANFCKGVARHDAGMVFDQESKARVFDGLYRQCLVTYALNDTGLRVADLGGGTVSY